MSLETLKAGGKMSNSNELTHYGIKGQKWGVRRYQNKDGTLTNLGKSRKNMDAVNDIVNTMSKKDKKCSILLTTFTKSQSTTVKIL